MNFKINENSCFCGHELMSQLITNVKHVILNFWKMYKAKIKFQKKFIVQMNEFSNRLFITSCIFRMN